MAGEASGRGRVRAFRWVALGGLLAVGAAACSSASAVPPPDDSSDSAGAGGKAGKSGTSGAAGAGSKTTAAMGIGGGGASSGGSGATAGGGGTSSGGSTGQGAGGSGSGSSAGPGGSSGSCPPSSFAGLPACATPGKHPCLTCACNDTSTQTLCAAKYAACRADDSCNKTVECVLDGCTVSQCEQFVGNSLQKLLDLQPCLQDTCKSECSTLLGGGFSQGGSGGTGSGGMSSGGSSSGGSGGAPTACKAGSFQCMGSKLQKCADDGSAFKDVMDCPSGTACDAGAGMCSAAGCGDGWTITYALSGKFQITNTPLGAGDATRDTGPGEVVLRFDDVGGSPGGKARLLSYKMPMMFSVDSAGLVVSTNVTATAAYADCGDATGSLNGTVLKWDTCTYGGGWSASGDGWAPGPDAGTGPGCVAGYNSKGNVNCKDGLFAKCSQGNLKNGDNPQDSTWNQPLNSFEFSADLTTFKMRGLDAPDPGGGGDKGVETPNTSPGRTWFNFDGMQTSKVKAPKPCSCN